MVPTLCQDLLGIEWFEATHHLFCWNFRPWGLPSAGVPYSGTSPPWRICLCLSRMMGSLPPSSCNVWERRCQVPGLERIPSVTMKKIHFGLKSYGKIKVDHSLDSLWMSMNGWCFDIILYYHVSLLDGEHFTLSNSLEDTDPVFKVIFFGTWIGDQPLSWQWEAIDCHDTI